MSNTGAGRAWRFLKRNPDYAAEYGTVADTMPPAESAPFAMRTQSPADRAAVKVEQGEASVQIRIDDAQKVDPAGGVVVCLDTGLDLGVRLHGAGDLWPVAAVETKKDGTGGVFASPTRSC